MKKFWILPITALMISCGAATEEAPVAEPVEEVAPVEEEVVADSTAEEVVADSTAEEATEEPATEEEHEGHDH